MTLKLADNPNRLSDRAAMALPDDLFVARTSATVLSTHVDLLRMTSAQWIAIAEAPDAPFERRYAAGTLLGFAGDPRIRALDPPMCDACRARGSAPSRRACRR